MKRRRDTRPTHLGRYELVREIGRGGMGVIFEGRDPRHDRSVAIKVLPKQGDADSERVGRFKREVQTIAMLSHAGIVRIFDVGEDDGRYYFVMEFVRGQSIKDSVADGGMALRRGLEVIEQMCHALAHAHRKGVIHRDINPNNILIEDGGRPVLIDFGIAKLADTSRLTRAGATIGTPRYLSPEQALGEPDVDERTDVYGLGATLYLIATGKPPFFDQGGKTVSLTAIEAGPTPASQVNARVPREVEAIIATAMARRRSDRYRSPAEMATDVRSYLTTGVLKIARPVRRGGGGWKLAAAAGVVLLAGGLVAAFGLGGGERPRPNGNGRTKPPRDGDTKDPSPTDPPVAPTPAGPSAAVLELVETADGLREKGNHADAVRAYFEALQEGAPKRLVLLGRAQSNAALGKWDLALADLAEARAIAELADATAELERTLLPQAVPVLDREGPPGTLIDALDRLLQVVPTGGTDLTWTALDALKVARESGNILERATQQPEAPATAYATAIYELHERHDAAKARTLLETAVAATPNFVEAWRALAAVCSRSADHRAAVEAIDKALSLKRSLRNLGVDAFIVYRAANRPDEAAKLREEILGALRQKFDGDNTRAEQEFGGLLVDAYATWNDVLAAAHHVEALMAMVPETAPQRTEWTRRMGDWIRQWDRLPPAQLANDNDRRYRRGSAVALTPDADIAACQQALDDLNSAVIADPHRLMAATLYELRASLLQRLDRWRDFRRDVESGFARNPLNAALRVYRVCCLVAEGESESARPLLDALIPADVRAKPNTLHEMRVLERACDAATAPSAGAERWLAQLDEVRKSKPDARLFEKYLAQCEGRLQLIQSVSEGRRPDIAALQAVLAAFRENWAGVDAACTTGASGLAHVDPDTAARASHGCAIAAWRRFRVTGADPATGRPALIGFFGEGAGWDADTAPTDERTAAWTLWAQAAMAAGLSGRALQAAERARALGATDPAVGETRRAATAALEAGAHTAYDLYRLGLLRAAAQDRFGARDALQRALRAETDGSLRDGERSAIAEALRGVR